MFTLILNPVSGGGKAEALLPRISGILVSRGITFETVYTSASMDDGYFDSVPCGNDDTIAILGGDGTVFDVVNRLPALDMTLIYIPCGTGNDFIKSLKLPKDPIKAFLRQLDGSTTPIDICQFQGGYFMNVCGTGFDVNVLNKLDGLRHKTKGLKAYLAAVYLSIREYKPFKAKITVDGVQKTEGDYTIISIGNGRFFGGGMKAVPDADLTDGYIDVVEIAAIKKWQIYILLPLFVLGLHTKLKYANTYRCRSIEVYSPGMTAQYDGELQHTDTINVRLLHNGIKVRI